MISSGCCCLSLVWIKTEVVLAFLGLNPGKRKKKTKEKETRRGKKVGRKKGRREGQGKRKSLFSTSHSCVFPQPGKHINPSAFLLGNKGTKPDCGGEGDKKDPGTLKRAKRETQGLPVCRHRDWHTQAQDPAETTGKWRFKDVKGQLLSPHPTCQEGKETAGEKRREPLSPQVRTGTGAGAAARPSLAKEAEGWEEKHFI